MKCLEKPCFCARDTLEGLPLCGVLIRGNAAFGRVTAKRVIFALGRLAGHPRTARRRPECELSATAVWKNKIFS